MDPMGNGISHENEHDDLPATFYDLPSEKKRLVMGWSGPRDRKPGMGQHLATSHEVVLPQS